MRANTHSTNTGTTNSFVTLPVNFEYRQDHEFYVQLLALISALQCLYIDKVLLPSLRLAQHQFPQEYFKRVIPSIHGCADNQACALDITIGLCKIKINATMADQQPQIILETPTEFEKHDVKKLNKYIREQLKPSDVNNPNTLITRWENSQLRRQRDSALYPSNHQRKSNALSLVKKIPHAMFWFDQTYLLEAQAKSTPGKTKLIVENFQKKYQLKQSEFIASITISKAVAKRHTQLVKQLKALKDRAGIWGIIGFFNEDLVNKEIKRKQDKTLVLSELESLLKDENVTPKQIHDLHAKYSAQGNEAFKHSKLGATFGTGRTVRLFKSALLAAQANADRQAQEKNTQQYLENTAAAA